MIEIREVMGSWEELVALYAAGHLPAAEFHAAALAYAKRDWLEAGDDFPGVEEVRHERWERLPDGEPGHQEFRFTAAPQGEPVTVLDLEKWER